MEIPAPVLAAIISAITAVIISLAADRVKSWLTKPKLEVEYDHTIAGCRVVNTGVQVWIRVRVRNTSKHIARQCAAYLVNISMLDSGEKILYDAPLLNWPHRHERNIDIVTTIDQFLNVVYSIKNLPNPNATNLNFPVSFKPSQMVNFEKNPKNCRLQIALLTEDGYRKDFAIDIIWGVSWDTINAKSFRA
jgi:hypothetical protein